MRSGHPPVLFIGTNCSPCHFVLQHAGARGWLDGVEVRCVDDPRDPGAMELWRAAYGPGGGSVPRLLLRDGAWRTVEGPNQILQALAARR